MNVDDVMDEVAAVADTIDGLRVFGYPADRITPPAIVVSYPEITFHETYRRGLDRYNLPVWLITGKSNDRATKKNLAPFLAGSGPSSIRAVLEDHQYTSCDALTVKGAAPDVLVLSDVEYMGYQFTVDIAGQGA